MSSKELLESKTANTNNNSSLKYRIILYYIYIFYIIFYSTYIFINIYFVIFIIDGIMY